MIGKWDEKNSFDYENGFYLTSQPYRLGNILAHYEIYKKILELPGDVIELGVFRGAVLFSSQHSGNCLRMRIPER